MSDIKAPGRSSLWTEAALRALTGTAFLVNKADEDEGFPPGGGCISPLYAREIALDAMAIADAFEQACEERERREAEARAEADGHIVHAHAEVRR